MTQFDKRNISMMMDLYEMTMANGYFANQQKTQKVVFDVFYRKNPDQGGYAVFAGLEQVVEYAENLHFDSADIDYFRSLNLFSEEFLQYLKEFRFTGDIKECAWIQETWRTSQKKSGKCWTMQGLKIVKS